MTTHNDPLTGHSYDGIEEYDNPLPGWWTNVWALTVIFSVFYVVHIHLGEEGKDLHSEYEAEAAEVVEARFAQLGVLAPVRQTLMTYKDDPQWRSVGRAVFQTHCASCHGKNGGGLVGVNLTDDHYKHVTTIEDIARVIENGAGGGAMPAWKNRLSHVNQVVLTAAYVASLRGTNVAGGKAPEGTEIPPWGEN